MYAKSFRNFTIAFVAAVCAQAADSVPGRLLVGFRREADRAAAQRVLLAHRASVRREFPALGVSAIDVPEETSDAAVASLRRSGAVEFVERDYYAHTAADPNDPSYLAQWHLPKIGSPLAWSLSTGSSAVIVAVIDSGVYPHHPDLVSKLVPGWNFIKGSSDTSDDLGHGTAVAGAVAAATNNGIGVAGVNWAARIMPLVAADENDFAAYSDIAAAIQYAVDHGVRVINISIGGTNPSTALQKAVDYAWSRGSLVFASAMNQAVSRPYYPAACQHAIAVSATDSNDRLASFSNYGSWITLSAPGTGILSTADGGGYSFWNGTSFASPIAAGVAALVLSVNPELTNQQVLDILERTADRPAGAGPAPDPYYGWGRVDAYRSVLAAEPPRAPVSRPFSPSHKGRD
jgi:subtilisin family serine protease